MSYLNLKINYTSGIESVDITSDDIFYSNLREFYESGNAHGLQTNNDKDYDKIMQICDKIADFVYEQADLLKEMDNV